MLNQYWKWDGRQGRLFRKTIEIIRIHPGDCTLSINIQKTQKVKVIFSSPIQKIKKRISGNFF